MAVRSSRAIALVLLLGATTLAGCLGDDATVAPGSPGGDLPPALRSMDVGPLRVVTANGTFVVPVLPGEARDPPDIRRLGHLDHWRAGQAGFRLLTDGKAFVLFVDPAGEAKEWQGRLVTLRVYGTEDNDTLAVGMWYQERMLPSAAPDVLRTPVVALPNDILRVGKEYAYEVHVFEVEDGPDCACTVKTEYLPGDLHLGAVVPVAADASTERMHTGVWNGTLVHHRSAPLTFRPTWDLTFEGPAEGTDRPDAIEGAPFVEPETGTYVFTFTGERVWLAELFFEFGHSKIHDTRPFARGNGSTSLRVQLDGWQPLEAYRMMPPEKGLDQSFQLAIDVDYEKLDDLPGESYQTFFATVTPGYRFGGSTYIAGTDGRGVEVVVAAGP